MLGDRELRTILQALTDDEFSTIVRILILTGRRREEIGGLKWDEVKLEVGLIALPSERTKNKKPHNIPLSRSVYAIIDALPRRDGREYVFGRGAGGFSGWSRCKARLDERIGKLNERPLLPWTIHDLRRSAVTGMAELGVQPHIIEAVLNHQSGHKGGIAGIYNRASYEREKAEALALWDEHIAALVEGRERKVVPLSPLR